MRPVATILDRADVGILPGNREGVCIFPATVQHSGGGGLSPWEISRALLSQEVLLGTAR